MSSSPGSPGPAMTLSPLYALTFCQIICLPLQIKARLAQGVGLPHCPAQRVKCLANSTHQSALITEAPREGWRKK